MRTTARPIVAMLLSAAAAAFAAGCQTEKPRPSKFTLETGTERIPVREDWQRFALANYAGELLVDLHGASDVRFIQPVTVSATRRVSDGQVQLIAIGDVDETDRQGKRWRHPFFVAWNESGNGWELVERDVLPGKPAPPPPAAITPATPTPAVPAPATTPGLTPAPGLAPAPGLTPAP